MNNKHTANGKVLLGSNTNKVCDFSVPASMAAIFLLLQVLLPFERQNMEWSVRFIK